MKATNHDEVVPKEKHVRALVTACTNSSSLRSKNAPYIASAIFKKLEQQSNSWLISLKTLIVMHRILRDGDFEAKLTFSKLGENCGVLETQNFFDKTNVNTQERSAFARVYGAFLYQKLKTLKELNFDIASEQTEAKSHVASMNQDNLLKALPSLQQLLRRLIECQPNEACKSYPIVEKAFVMSVRESFRVYRAMCDGISNLLDLYFDMPSSEANSALEMYKRAQKLTDSLQSFYEFAGRVSALSSTQFPRLEPYPDSLLQPMEDYAKGGGDGDSPRPSATNKDTRRSHTSQNGEQMPTSSGKPTAGSANDNNNAGGPQSDSSALIGSEKEQDEGTGSNAQEADAALQPPPQDLLEGPPSSKTNKEASGDEDSFSQSNFGEESWEGRSNSFSGALFEEPQSEPNESGKKTLDMKTLNSLYDSAPAQGRQQPLGPPQAPAVYANQMQPQQMPPPGCYQSIPPQQAQFPAQPGYVRNPYQEQRGFGLAPRQQPQQQAQLMQAQPQAQSSNPWAQAQDAKQAQPHAGKQSQQQPASPSSPRTVGTVSSHNPFVNGPVV